MGEVRPITSSYRYWSNACGEFFGPDDKESRPLIKSELPKPLQELFDNLWTDEKMFLCYLAELDGKYGIALEGDFNEIAADDYGITYAKYIKIAKAYAKEIADRFPQYTVMFSKDSRVWSDGTKDSTLAVFMPYGVTKEEFDDVDEFMGEHHPDNSFVENTN
jgi:hypothetical protein